MFCSVDEEPRLRRAGSSVPGREGASDRRVRERLSEGGSRAGTARGSPAKIWEDRERRGGESSRQGEHVPSTKAGTNLADSSDSNKGGGEDEVEGLLPEKSFPSITKPKPC